MTHFPEASGANGLSQLPQTPGLVQLRQVRSEHTGLQLILSADKAYPEKHVRHREPSQALQFVIEHVACVQVVLESVTYPDEHLKHFVLFW